MKLEIRRTIDAARTAVFEEWTNADNLAGWFAPDDYEVTEARMDARVGGRWRVAYRKRTSEESHVEEGEILDLEAPSRLVFTLTQSSGGKQGPRTTVTVTLTETSDGTLMTFEQTGFTSEAHRDGNAEGWGECLDRMELRLLFAAWFDASARKDIEGAMRPIALDVVSYEHQETEVRGKGEVRRICQTGFDRMPATGFRWDMPKIDLRIQGSLAVAWGMNRMRWPGGEAHSRSTRVFEKRDGRWQMIHQHLSFPAKGE